MARSLWTHGIRLTRAFPVRLRSVMVRLLLGGAAVATIATPAARATDYTWNNTTANWNVGANWTPGGGPPVAADNAFLLGATAYTVTLNDNRAINNLTINNASAILHHTAGTFSVGGTINLAAGQYRLEGGTISGGSITSTGGTLNLRSSNNNILNNVAVGVGVLDLASNFGRVRLQGSTSLASGTAITLPAGGGLLAFEQTVTTGNLTVTMQSASNLSVEGTNTLTFGSGTTITHGSLGTANITAEQVVAGNSTILNQGLIVNTSAGAINIAADTFTNQAGGIVRLLGGAININSGGVINTASGTGGFEVVAGNFNLNGTNWINNGKITISGGNLNLNGTFTTAGIGLGTIARTGGIVNLTGALDNAAATLALTAGTGSFQLNGSTITGGSITAAGGSTLQVAFNNNNRLNNVAVGAGVLSFGGSGSGSRVRFQGTTSLAAGSVIDLSGGTIGFDQSATLNNATLNMTFNGAAVSVEGTNTFTIGSTSTISANNAGTGTNVLLGNQTFVAGANAVLNQGLIRSTGTGILTINPTTFLNQSGGIVRATAGNVVINNGGTINAAGGIFDVNGGTLNLGGTSWNNAGTITVSSGTLNLGGSFVLANIGTVTRTGGTIAITGALDNAATTLALTATTGSYQLNGGTITGGSITAAGGATLQPQNNNNNRLNNVALGAGVLDFSTASGRVRLQGTTSLASGTIIDLSGGNNILAFEQTATVNGVAINVSSGSVSVTVEPTYTLTLGPATTFTQSSTFGNIRLGNQFTATGAATLLNQGLIRNTGSGALSIEPGTLTSTGTVRATAGGIAIPIATNLTNFAGNTLTGGTWEAAGTGNLNFGTRTINTIAAGTTVTLDGAGSVFAAINPLTTNNGTFNVLGGRTFAVAAPFTNAGTITVGAGSSLTAAAANAFTLSGGTLTGAGTKTFAGAFNWTGTGGTISGSAPSLNGTSTFSGTTMTIDGVALVPAVGGTWGAGTISLVNSASFAVPVGTTLANTGDTSLTGGTGSNALSVAGTIRKTAGTGTTSLGAGATTTLTGTVDAQSGTFLFPGNLTSTGVLNSAAGATLDFGGTAGLNAGSYTGQGNVRVSAGTTTGAINLPLATNANLTVNGTLSMSAGTTLSTQATGTATLAGGTLTGAGAKTFNGAFDWSGTGGTISGAAPTLNGVNTFTGTTMTLDGVPLAPATGASWVGGDLVVANGGTLRAVAGQVLVATGAGSITGSGSGTNALDVAGTFRKGGGAGTATLGAGLTVQVGAAGTLESLAGTLAVTGNLANLSAGTLAGGTYRAVDATLTLPSNVTTLAAGTTVTLDGAGSVFAAINPLTTNNGTFNVLNGRAFALAAPFTNTGTMTVGSGSSATGAAFTHSGTLGGAGSLTLSGLLTWTGGSMVGTGATAATGGLALSGGGVVLDRTLNQAGVATWTGTGDVTGNAGAVWNVQAGATFTASTSQSFLVGSGTPTFTNAGTFTKSTGTGTTAIAWAFTNTGTVNVQTGTLAVPLGLANSGTLQINTGASLVGNVNTSSGIVSGMGTIAGNVGFGGTGNSLRPGASPGNLTVTGNLTLNAGTTYVAEVNGTTVGTQYDRVTVTGAANVVTLAGATLNVVLGYDPAANDRVFLVDNQTGAAVNGTFAGLPTNGSQFQVTNPNTSNMFFATVFYVGDINTAAISGGNDVVLVFTPVPEPGSLALILVPVAAWWVRRRRLAS